MPELREDLSSLRAEIDRLDKYGLEKDGARHDRLEREQQEKDRVLERVAREIEKDHATASQRNRERDSEQEKDLATARQRGRERRSEQEKDLETTRQKESEQARQRYREKEKQSYYPNDHREDSMLHWNYSDVRKWLSAKGFYMFVYFTEGGGPLCSGRLLAKCTTHSLGSILREGKSNIGRDRSNPQPTLEDAYDLVTAINRHARHHI